MNNNLQIDLNNAENYPALAAINSFLFDFEKNDLDFIKTHYGLPEVIDFAHDFFYTKMAGIDFEDLLKEREGLAINIQVKEQREFIINVYNRKVIESIKRTIDFIQDGISFYFPLEFNEPEKQLCLSNHFTEWYQQFPIIEDTGTNAAPQAAPEPIPEKKLKWLGNASHLGYFIYQLADKGFIEYPLHNGEVNYTGLAERLLNAFEFKDKTPAKKYLSEQINPESENNKISDTNKLKLKLNIPNLQDLS